MDDFVIEVHLVIQDTKGNDVAEVGSEVLSDATLQMIMEDLAEFLNEKEGV